MIHYGCKMLLVVNYRWIIVLYCSNKSHVGMTSNELFITTWKMKIKKWESPCWDAFKFFLNLFLFLFLFFFLIIRVYEQVQHNIEVALGNFWDPKAHPYDSFTHTKHILLTCGNFWAIWQPLEELLFVYASDQISRECIAMIAYISIVAQITFFQSFEKVLDKTTDCAPTFKSKMSS